MIYCSLDTVKLFVEPITELYNDGGRLSQTMLKRDLRAGSVCLSAERTNTAHARPLVR